MDYVVDRPVSRDEPQCLLKIDSGFLLTDIQEKGILQVVYRWLVQFLQVTHHHQGQKVNKHISIFPYLLESLLGALLELLFVELGRLLVIAYVSYVSLNVG